MEISLKEFIELIIKKIWLISLCLVVFTLGAYAVTKLFIKPKYASSIVFLISYEGSDQGSNANSDFTYSMNVMNNCVELLNQNDFYNGLSSHLIENNINVSAEDVKKATAFSVKAKTTVLSITVTTHDPKRSFDIAYAMGQNVGQYIEDMYPQAGSGTIKVKKINTPEYNDKPVYPNTLLNTVIGAVGGLGIGVVLVLLIAKFDIRIKSEDDLTAKYDFPVLGVVPKFGNAKEVK